MARRPQHPLQIMATETHFNLTTAIESWRNELAAQPQFTADDRRELERHLTDTVAELRERGLNDEEAFWLARRRIGRPQELAEEFEKANPAEVWRERLFWMAAGMMLFWQTALTITYFEGVVFHFIPEMHGFYQRNWALFQGLPILLIGSLLAKGVLGRSSKPIWFFQSRWRLAALLIVLIMLGDFANLVDDHMSNIEAGRNYSIGWATWLQGYSLRLLGYFKFTIAPLIFLIWLLPQQKKKAAISG